MKHETIFRNALIIACLFVFPFIARAEGTTPFQLGLFHPAQIFSDDYSVDGFRLNLVYGINQEMRGIDLGIVNETENSTHGFELGLDNRVGQDFGGAQLGLFNEVKRDFNGFQLGLLGNITRRSCEGVQVSVFYNNADEELQGLQIGLVNHTGSLQGVQIGLVNFNDDERYKGFMPFVNAVF